MSDYILQPTPHVPDQERLVEQFGEYYVMSFNPPGSVIVSKGTPDDFVAYFNQRVTEIPDLTAKTLSWLFRQDDVDYNERWTSFVAKTKELFGIDIPEKLKPQQILEKLPPERKTETINLEEEIVEEKVPEIVNTPQIVETEIVSKTDEKPHSRSTRKERHDDVELTALEVLESNECFGQKTMYGGEIYRLAKIACPNLNIEKGYYQCLLSQLGKDPSSKITCAGRKQGFYVKKDENS